MENRLADYHQHAHAPFEQGFRCFDKLASMGVTDANLLAVTYIDTGIDNNVACLYYKAKCRSVRLWTFGGLYYDPGLNNRIMSFKEQAELLLAMGCDGIKFLDMKPNFNLYCGCSMDEAVYDDLYDMLEKDGIPLVVHIADPENFWDRSRMTEEAIKAGWCYDDPKFLTQQQIFDCAVRRLEKNPRLRLCFAHCGYFTRRLEFCHELFERYPNICFDLAPGWEIFVDFAGDIEGWRKFFAKYSTRILYGTDAATSPTPEDFELSKSTIIECLSHDESSFPIPLYPAATMRGFQLAETARRNILYDNFFRILGHTPKPVNTELVKTHARFLRSIATATEIQQTLDFVLDNL